MQTPQQQPGAYWQQQQPLLAGSVDSSSGSVHVPVNASQGGWNGPPPSAAAAPVANPWAQAARQMQQQQNARREKNAFYIQLFALVLTIFLLCILFLVQWNEVPLVCMPRMRIWYAFQLCAMAVTLLSWAVFFERKGDLCASLCPCTQRPVFFIHFLRFQLYFLRPALVVSYIVGAGLWIDALTNSSDCISNYWFSWYLAFFCVFGLLVSIRAWFRLRFTMAQITQAAAGFIAKLRAQAQVHLARSTPLLASGACASPISLPALHPHALVLQPSVYNGSFRCNLCGEHGMAQAYNCAPCKFDAHPDCAHAILSGVPIPPSAPAVAASMGAPYGAIVHPVAASVVPPPAFAPYAYQPPQPGQYDSARV